MLYENIDKYIMEAMKSHDEVRTAAMRMIKAKFLEYKTSKGAKPIDELIEMTILKKMVEQREESAEMYASAGRTVLAEKEIAEMNVIKEFLPAPVTEEQLIDAFNEVIASGVDPVKKNMGMFIKTIKTKYPSADGKVVSTLVSSRLN